MSAHTGSLTRDLGQKHARDEEQRQRSEHLWRNEERFRLLVDGVEEYAIFMLDPRGVVTTWNVGAERIKGYRADEIIGKHFSVFRTAEDVAAGACEQELATAVSDGKLANEGWRVRKDGSRFWASVALSALRDNTGKLMGFAKITRDLTQRRQLEEERLQRARAEEAVRLRDEFLLIASHELKTPLTSLQIDLHGMGRDPVDPDKQQRRLERAVRNVERLNGLIDSLLDVSRLAHGQLVLEPTRMELREAVTHVLAAMRGQASRAGCEVRLLAPHPVPGTWDPMRVEQVVMNLLSNAIKYGAGAPITVVVGEEGREAVLEIRDAGPGVATADTERIFQRFERASSIRHFGGLGLGLYIAREIVNAHGGSITVRNHPDGGAALTVRLPLAQAAEANRAAPC